MSSEKKSSSKVPSSRREFVKKSLFGIGSLAALSAFGGCASLDEYVFEDQFDLKDQLMIVGGGISGLYLAYKLRQSRSEYRLLEGSSYLGGRIRSYQGLDFGASVFNHSDALLVKLIKDFNLTTTSISKELFYIPGGAESLTSSLQKRIIGLLPYRTLRVEWKLISIRKNDNKYKAVFSTPNGHRTLVTKKVALTIPPSQWANVDGLLDLPDMSWGKAWLKTLKPVSATKILVAPSNLNISSLSTKKNAQLVLEKDLLNLVVKTGKSNLSGLEFEYLTSQVLNPINFKIENPNRIEIEKIVDQLCAKTKLRPTLRRLTAESFFDWSSVDLIQSAYFRNTEPLPQAARDNPHFQVIGDFTARAKNSTVEGALTEAERVSSVFV